MTEFLTDRDIAKRLGVHWQYVQEACRNGRWPYVKVGRTYRFTEEIFEEIKASLIVRPLPADEQGEMWGQKKRQAS